MRASDRRLAVAGLLLAAALAGRAEALSPAQKCQAAKLKITGKYAFCRLKADAKAVKTGQPADYTKCDGKFTSKFGDAEAQAGGMCPTQGDVSGVESQVIADTTAFRQLQARFVDNGDGTVSDTQTGLMWEQKDSLGGGANLGDPHDADNTYTWSSTATAADGTAFTDFLLRLNACDSTDGSTLTGGFASHCDWRLPTSAELQTIVDLTATGCGTGSPCIDSTFGPTVASFYWSSTTLSGTPLVAWVVDFDVGSEDFGTKILTGYVRAVRGGL